MMGQAGWMTTPTQLLFSQCGGDYWPDGLLRGAAPSRAGCSQHWPPRQLGAGRHEVLLLPQGLQLLMYIATGTLVAAWSF